MITDPISDMLTRLRNAAAVCKTQVPVPYSGVKLGLAKILEREGYLTKVDVVGEGKGREIQMTIRMRGVREPAIGAIRRVSTPGHRVYRKSTEMENVRSGFGCAIISTSSGMMTHTEARSRKLGGEVICEVY